MLHGERCPLTPGAAAEQPDAFEYGVADRTAAFDQNIFETADAKQVMRIGGTLGDGRADGVEVSLLEIGPVVDLGNAQGDGRAQGIGGDTRAAVEDQRNGEAPARWRCAFCSRR